MARNFTRELRKAALDPSRARVVCSLAPYEGQAMEYSPRSGHDPKPWVLVIDGTVRRGYRFTGRECHVQVFRYVVVAHQSRFYVIDTGTDTYTGPALDGRVSGPLAVGQAYTSRYAATDAAKRLEKNGPLVFAQQENVRSAVDCPVLMADDLRQVVRISRGKRRRDFNFTVTVGSAPHYFNDQNSAQSFAGSYGVSVIDNRKA